MTYFQPQERTGRTRVPTRVKNLLERMKDGKALVVQYDFNHDACYFLEPGGLPVGSWTAMEAIRRCLVVTGDDGLFPDSAQTWRLPK